MVVNTSPNLCVGMCICRQLGKGRVREVERTLFLASYDQYDVPWQKWRLSHFWKFSFIFVPISAKMEENKKILFFNLQEHIYLIF